MPARAASPRSRPRPSSAADSGRRASPTKRAGRHAAGRSRKTSPADCGCLRNPSLQTSFLPQKRWPSAGAAFSVPASAPYLGGMIAELTGREAMLRTVMTPDAAIASDAAVGPLPEWDLSDLYPGRDSPELQRDLAVLAAKATAFRERCASCLAGLSGAELGAAMAEYEKFQEIIGRIMSYAELLRAGNVADPAIAQFFQTTHERINAISTELLFFTLELNRIDDAALDGKLAEPALAYYRPWLRDVRAMRPYQLSDELEKLLHEKSVAGRTAWTRLFDETIADLRFPFRGRDLTEPEAMHLLSDGDGAVRKEAALSIGEVFGRNVRLFGLITNTLAKDKEIEDRWRGFPRPISSRNLSNYVEDEVVDALISAVRAAYPSLSHRYYQLKARWFVVEELTFFGRNEPLPVDVYHTSLLPDAAPSV